MLDFIKHCPSILSTFLELGAEPFMFLDGDSEHWVLIKCLLHRGRLLPVSLVEMAKISTAGTAIVNIVQYHGHQFMSPRIGLMIQGMVLSLGPSRLVRQTTKLFTRWGTAMPFTLMTSRTCVLVVLHL